MQRGKINVLMKYEFRFLLKFIGLQRCKKEKPQKKNWKSKCRLLFSYFGLY
jgi:hypothetical protein